MDSANWTTWILQTIILLTIGIAGYFIKCTLAELKSNDEKNAGEITEVRKELNDLKSDLPFIYVLREDFIRSLNNVDTRMRDIDGKLDKLLQMKSKGDGS